MQQKTSQKIRAMTECSIMIALSTVLSLIKIIDMPYGGSVTIASMLPIVIAVYRHGFLFGVGCATVNSAIQLLLGLNNLSYFSTWQSLVAVILLDYILAFGVFALSGSFKRLEPRQNYAMIYGVILASVLRYVCHTVAGATVWAGLSIPTEAALLYSLSYNATFMIPETIVLLALTAYISGVIDFKAKTPTRVKKAELDKRSVAIRLITGLIPTATAVVDVCLVFPHLQDPDSGEFVFTHLKNADFILIAVVSAIGALLTLSLLIYEKYRKNGKKA